MIKLNDSWENAAVRELSVELFGIPKKFKTGRGRSLESHKLNKCSLFC
jgi:hypothetical protein